MVIQNVARAKAEIDFSPNANIDEGSENLISHPRGTGFDEREYAPTVMWGTGTEETRGKISGTVLFFLLFFFSRISERIRVVSSERYSPGAAFSNSFAA